MPPLKAWVSSFAAWCIGAEWLEGECAGLSGERVPSHTIQYPSGLLGPGSTPLFKVKCHAGVPALIPNGSHPVRIHRSVAGPRFSAHDDPIQFGQSWDS